MSTKPVTAEKTEKFPDPPTTPPPAEVLPTLTTEQAKALGAAFLKDQELLEKAEAAETAARTKRSASIEAIVKAYGYKGPFTIGGRNWNAKQAKSTGNWTMVEQTPARVNLG